MSKNTFVMITESVKNGSQGLGKYVNYLENPNHKNHAQTSSIFTTFEFENIQTISSQKLC